MTKNIVVYNPARFSSEIWLPTFWSEAKTYYELNGQCVNQWNWVPCYADTHADNIDRVKQYLIQNPPDIFAVSLYVWNYIIAHQVAKWVKEQWPKCVIITGGPHQYFKYDLDWFKKHPWIDASLPGECYGELCLSQILDNYNNGEIDFDKVSDICYPLGQSKLPTYSKNTSTIIEKKKFRYDYPLFALQETYITDFVNYCQREYPESKILAVLETTRGCPYGCTYCDWGGGISTAVIKKSIETVKQDIDLLCSYPLSYLYIADANFGIFKERDVEVMKHIVDTRVKTKNYITLGYGGWAKTENKLSYVKELITLDVTNNLSNSKEIKISMQSLDADVLHNIDRKNIPLDKQLEILEPLSNKNKLPLYVEMIMGLPGLTLDKFYWELDELAKRNLSAMWFEWILLPETPAYDPAYRSHFGIKTVNKTNGWAWYEPGGDRPVVIASNDYSSENYLEMLLASGIYDAVMQGGFYKDSVLWISENKNIQLGQIIREFLYQCPPPQDLIDHWNDILLDPNKQCTIELYNHNVYLRWYYVIRNFFEPDTYEKQFSSFLKRKYNCNIQNDAELTVNINTFGTRTLSKDYFWQNKEDDPWEFILKNFLGYHNSGNILRAKPRLRFWKKTV